MSDKKNKKRYFLLTSDLTKDFKLIELDGERAIITTVDPIETTLKDKKERTSEKAAYKILKKILLEPNRFSSIKDVFKAIKDDDKVTVNNKQFDRTRKDFVGIDFFKDDNLHLQNIQEINQEIFEYSKANFKSPKIIKNDQSLYSMIDNKDSIKELYYDIYDRTYLLESITKKLNNMHIVGLIGEPGVGKSTLIYSFVFNNSIIKEEYKNIFYLRCDNPNAFLDSLFIEQKNSSIFDELMKISVEKIEKVIDSYNEKILLVFDNISHDDRVLNDNPNGFRFHNILFKIIQTIYNNYKDMEKIDIIYTSRYDVVLGGCDIRIDEFTEQQSREYLQKDIDFLNDEEKEEIDKIVKKTSLPIVLSSIKYLAKEKKTYKDISMLSQGDKLGLTDVMSNIFTNLNESVMGKTFIQILNICSIIYNNLSLDLILSITDKLNIKKDKVIAVLNDYSYKTKLLQLDKKITINTNYKDITVKIHREYQDAILYLYDGNIDELTNIYESTINVFKDNINTYSPFSMKHAIAIENNISHIYKIAVDHLYESDDFNELLIECMYYFGTNYNSENEYYIGFSSYFPKKIKNKFIKTLYDICVSQVESDKMLKNRVERFDESRMLTTEQKEFLKVKISYALATIYRETEQNESIKYFEKCCRDAEQLFNSCDLDKSIYFYQYYIASCFRLSQIYTKTRLFDKHKKCIDLCIDKLSFIKNDYDLCDNYVDFEYLEAKVNNAKAVYAMESYAGIDVLKQGLEDEKAALDFYNTHKLLHEQKNIYYNLSLYYIKLAENNTKNYCDFEIFVYTSIYYIELYLEKRNNLKIYISDNSGNYYLQYYLSLYKLLDVWNNKKNKVYISLDKEELKVKVKEEITKILGDQYKDISDENLVNNIIDNNIVSGESNECDKLYAKSKELLQKEMELSKGSLTTDMNELTRYIKESSKPQKIIRIIRYYGSLCKKMVQLFPNNDEYYNEAVIYFELSIHLNNILNNNGQKAFSYKELCIVHDIRYKNASHDNEKSLAKLKELMNSKEMIVVFSQLSDNDGKKKWYIDRKAKLENE